MSEINKKKVRKAVKDAEEWAGGTLLLSQKIGVSPGTIRNWRISYAKIPYEKAYLIDELTDGLVKLADLIPTHPAKRLPR